MPHIPNVKFRQLPLGRTLRRRLRGLGDDGSDDVFSDISSSDLTDLYGNYSAPTLPITSYAVPVAPSLPASDTTFDLNPVAINQVTGQPDYLPTDIAAVNPLDVSTAQAAAAGLSPADASAAVLAAGGTPAQAAQAAAAATKAAGQVLTSTGAARPSPVTVATGLPAAGVTYANPLNALQQATIISGVPNYMILAGIVGVALLAGSGGGRRR